MQSNYLVVDVKNPIRSSCGKARLGRGYHKVCWTDGPRFTVWGQPRIIYFTSDVEVHDWDNASEWKANKMKAYHNKGNTMTQVNLPPMTNGGTIEKAGDLMVAKYNTAKPVTFTGAQLLEMAMQKEDTFTTCEVTFDSSSKFYTYKLPRHWNVWVGQQAVVMVPDGSLKLVTIEALHDAPQLNPKINYKWLVTVIDTATYANIVAEEAQLTAEVKKAVEESERKSALKQLEKHAVKDSFLANVLKDIAG